LQDVTIYGDAVIVVHANKKQASKLSKYFVIQQLIEDLPKVIIKVIDQKHFQHLFFAVCVVTDVTRFACQSETFK
jgi:hypothetical protein